MYTRYIHVVIPCRLLFNAKIANRFLRYSTTFNTSEIVKIIIVNNVGEEEDRWVRVPTQRDGGLMASQTLIVKYVQKKETILSSSLLKDVLPIVINPQTRYVVEK